MATTMALIGAHPVGAAEPISASADGRRISLEQAGSMSCHDLDFPTLRCFTSSAAMELDAVGRLGSFSPDGGVIAVLDVGYVIVYEHASYGGSSLLLSADQAWLSSIGWNDRISSFKSFGATGNFRENSPTGGWTYALIPGAQVSSLSGTYNDKFSALYLN